MKLKSFKQFENNANSDTLIIVDVQKSFKKFFTDMYINELKKHCSNFKEVYLIWDNHVHGKDVDKDFLYDTTPEVPINDDLYNFPNLKDRVEKRYNYDVDIDYYKKILDSETYKNIKKRESKNELKRGELFETKEGTAIVFIGNKHRWFHIPIKLYKLFKSLKGKTIEMVGGSDQECYLDLETSAKSLGVNIKRNYKYIYSASHCPIKYKIPKNGDFQN